MSKRKQSKTSRQVASERPVVAFTPPRCPHCHHVGYLKQRGADLTVDHRNGRISNYFTVKCKKCGDYYKLREITEIKPAESAG